MNDIGIQAPQPLGRTGFKHYIDFHNISPVPSSKELLSSKNKYLEKYIIHDSHLSVEHYINFHFNLLREDFLRSVKSGLFAYIAKDDYKAIKVHCDIKIFEFEKPKTWTLALPENELIKINKNPSTRFCPGSFLLFSNNNCMSLYTAVVLHSSQKAFETQGIFKVDFCGDVPCWNLTQKFITLESEAYFEPYKRVLSALRNIQLNGSSVFKYILNTNEFSNIRLPLPSYLKNVKNFEVGEYLVDPSHKSIWPGSKKLGLDRFQCQAFRGALTQELCLIQGPPGTGKTYLGIQIVKILIQNKTLWKKDKGGPILIVCYTNHALDQFLEGILDVFTPKQLMDSYNPYIIKIPKIVRIGGGSKSKRVDKYITNTMEGADIVFMTTTGAAKRQKQLIKIRSRIMIVEEAAEVFEGHIISCLTPYIEQLILLGDHQQLRPIPATQEMSHEYNLDISLFERLASNNIEMYTLVRQYRMRPEIRDLITGTIYTRLIDDGSVKCYPNVWAMEHNLYFIDHKELERDTRLPGSFSKANDHEANFILELCEYLILKGDYECDRIVILATYMSQVILIKSIQNEYWICKGVRVETADSYQGEEKDIVLLSLVRSNTKNDIGYMKTDNRICVALSRAKHGLYIIGNMSLLSKYSHTWKIIKQKLEDGGRIGPSLTLIICSKHNYKIQVTYPRDFFLHNTGCQYCKDSLVDV